jgi:hypothetical protein
MTIEQAIGQIRSHTAHGWHKSKPIPNDLMAALCDALWDAGEHPQVQSIVRHLPHLHELAIRPGFHAWRAARGLPHRYPRWENPNIGGTGVLAKLVSPEIAHAPWTFFDAHNEGRWPAPHPQLIAYLGAISNQSLRDVMALYVLIKSGCGEQPLYRRLSSYAVPLRKLMEEYGLASVHDIDPDDLLLRVCEKKAGSSLTENQRSFVVLGWNTLSNAFQEYGERLGDAQRQSLPRFFLKAVAEALSNAPQPSGDPRTRPWPGEGESQDRGRASPVSQTTFHGEDPL